MQNKFITVEGGEGVGKSLFLTNLTSSLRSLSIHVVQTREPGGTPVADKLRSLFNAPPESDPLLIESEFLIVSAARAQHTKHKIVPALEDSGWVLSDRYADSSRVYQGYVGGLDQGFIEDVISKTTFGLTPDITFILDCDLEVSMNRVQVRSETSDEDGASRYDYAKASTHKKLRDGFLKLESRFSDRIVVLDASQSPEKVVADAMKIINEKFQVS